ncbi:hypothetical protein HWI79_2 [Cryptosporidium felis]|nr:hypothetical protein HWI79_2 [Cryptosporidium felis]
MYSKASSFLFLFFILANLFNENQLNIRLNETYDLSPSCIQVKTGIGPGPGQDGKPNERKRKGSPLEGDSSSQHHCGHLSRRLKVEEGETSTGQFGFSCCFSENLLPCSQTCDVTEEDILNAIFMELESRGIDKSSVTREEIYQIIDREVRHCYRKWTQTKKDLKYMESSLNELEERQRSSPGSDTDEGRDFVDRYNVIVMNQERVMAIEGLLATRYNLLLLLRDKYRRRSDRHTHRQGAQDVSQAPTSSSALTSQPSIPTSASGSSRPAFSSPSTSRGFTRVAQTGRNSRSGSRKKIRRRRRRRL